jgi:hypothetical protein
MRELCAGLVKVPLKLHSLDSLVDVTYACTELDKDLDDPVDDLHKSYTNSGFAEDLLRHHGISVFIEFRDCLPAVNCFSLR